MGTPSKSPPLNPLKTPKLEMENSSKAFLPLEKMRQKMLWFQCIFNSFFSESKLLVFFFDFFHFCFKIILGYLDFYNCQLHRFVHNRKSLQRETIKQPVFGCLCIDLLQRETNAHQNHFSSCVPLSLSSSLFKRHMCTPEHMDA